MLWLSASLLLGGVVFGLIKFSNNESNQTALLINTISSSDSDWVKGAKDAQVVLVEYSDFQCPACAFYFSLLKQLDQEFSNKIQFIYRHFPLKQIHVNAESAAWAAEAAGRQGKFWEMHDMIFENQATWSSQKNTEDIFLSYAQSLGLNSNQFKIDFDSNEVKEKVTNDYAGGIESEVNATPTFFLNGQKIKNPSNYDEFRNIIKEAIDSNS